MQILTLTWEYIVKTLYQMLDGGMIIKDKYKTILIIYLFYDGVNGKFMYTVHLHGLI